MKAYLYGFIALAVVTGLSTSHIMSYNAGKRNVMSRLANDRITILQDGKRIDDKVLNADDDTLLCLIVECVPDR